MIWRTEESMILSSFERQGSISELVVAGAGSPLNETDGLHRKLLSKFDTNSEGFLSASIDESVTAFVDVDET